MIEIFADGVSLKDLPTSAQDRRITGWTYNPTLAKSIGVTDYKAFCEQVVDILSKTRPETSVSLEVIADDYDGMIRQAQILDAIGKDRNYKVYVKIPVTFTNGESTKEVYKMTTYNKIPTNITAVFTAKQNAEILANINPGCDVIISIFAGRINDVGKDASGVVSDCTFEYDIKKKNNLQKYNKVKYLWASTRQVYSIIDAENCGCDIITATPDILKKMNNFGKDLTEYSLETVKMFYADAVASGFTL